MEGYGPETYGERIAEAYDDLFYPPTSVEDTVEFLAGLAEDGPVLELAIGTGRIALPLAARGIEVHGIDASEAMVAKLRAKPGGGDIPVTIGDFTDVGVQGRYRLIAIVFNTLWALLTQEDQVRCVQNVADHLTEDGTFVTEMFVPDPARFDRDQRVQVRNIESRRVVLETSKHDAGNQRVSSQLIALQDGGGISMSRSSSDTSGRPDSTSWPSSLASGCANAGGDGSTSPSSPPGCASRCSRREPEATSPTFFRGRVGDSQLAPGVSYGHDSGRTLHRSGASSVHGADGTTLGYRGAGSAGGYGKADIR